jgi:hypothetical protein
MLHFLVIDSELFIFYLFAYLLLLKYILFHSNKVISASQINLGCSKSLEINANK